MPPLSDILLVATAILVAMAPMTASFLQCWADRARGGNSGAPDGRSYCDSCGKTLSAIDLVPVLSWLWNRGKSRCCKEPLSPALLWPEAAAFGFALWGALVAPLALAVPTVALVWALQIVILLYALRPDVSNATICLLVLLGLGLSTAGLTGPFWQHAAGLAIGLGVIALSRVLTALQPFSDAALILAAAGALLGIVLLPLATVAGALFAACYRVFAPSLGLPRAEWPRAAVIGISGGLWLAWLYGGTV
ncbi:MAG: prepilin peptidase [Silicimonas sp.]|nr:prepilin peptidase [Silicimonas sp.]